MVVCRTEAVNVCVFMTRVVISWLVARGPSGRIAVCRIVDAEVYVITVQVVS